MQNNSNLFDSIRDWAKEKKIYDKGDLKSQTLKLHEETGELSKAILENDKAEIIDAIGDCVVVLTNVAALASIHFREVITIESCIESAYNVISNRKGKMINGTFIKDE